MIESKRIYSFPCQSALGEVSGRETEMSEVVRSSKRAWLLSINSVPLCVIGIWKLTGLGSGLRLWFVPFPEFLRRTKSTYRFIRSALRKLYRAQIVIDSGDSRAVRFARHLGFRPNGHSSAQYHFYVSR